MSEAMILAPASDFAAYTE